MKLKSSIFYLLFQLVLVLVSLGQEISPIPINAVFFTAENNYSSMIEVLNENNDYPRSINTDNSIRIVGTSDWTSGFFPGSLWYLFENTETEIFKTNAIDRTSPISDRRFATNTHDLGFIFYCSFGNGLRLTETTNYKPIMLDAANLLISRYNLTVGCIRSWDFGSWEFPVIIDNMMNLELLFWATKYSGDSTYYNIAVSHAQNTLKNHFRADNSSYHVVDNSTSTGEVISKTTHQGYSDESFEFE